MSDDERKNEEVLSCTAEILSAYLRKNPVGTEELPTLIESVHATLAGLGAPAAEAPPEPAVPVRKSVGRDHIVCLECGRKLKMLKRHLQTDHGLTPAEYRARWGLPPTYPMVAESHSAKRQQIAREIGLGQRADTGRQKGGRR